MKLDAGKLTRQDRLVAGTAVIAFICLFLPWYGGSAGGFSASVSGWSSGYGWLGGLLIVAAGVLLLAQRAGADTSWVRLTPAVVVLGASALGTLIVVIRWLTMPSGHYGFAGAGGFSYGPRFGIILTIVLGLIQLVVAARLFRASGEALPWKQRAEQ